MTEPRVTWHVAYTDGFGREATYMDGSTEERARRFYEDFENNIGARYWRDWRLVKVTEEVVERWEDRT